MNASSGIVGDGATNPSADARSNPKRG